MLHGHSPRSLLRSRRQVLLPGGLSQLILFLVYMNMYTSPRLAVRDSPDFGTIGDCHCALVHSSANIFHDALTIIFPLMAIYDFVSRIAMVSLSMPCLRVACATCAPSLLNLALALPHLQVQPGCIRLEVACGWRPTSAQPTVLW